MNKTRLFINRVGELHNPNMAYTSTPNGIYDYWWNFPAGTQVTEYGIMPPPDNTQRQFAITQDIGINGSGLYKISIELDGDPLNYAGRYRVTIGNTNTMSLNLVADAPGVFVQEFEQTQPDANIGYKIAISASGGTYESGYPAPNNLAIKSVNLIRIDTETNWEEIDLYDDIDIPITYNVGDVKDITQKDSNYSLTVQVPNTPHNAKVFDLVSEISRYNGSFELLKQYKAFVEVDGNRVFDGFLQLSKVVVNDDQEVSYEVNLCSNFMNFVQKLGTTTLRGNANPLDDLDFSDYTMTLDSHQWYDRTDMFIWDAQGEPIGYKPFGKNCYFAVVDKYNLSARNWIHTSVPTEQFEVDTLPMYYDELTPFLFYKEILDRIFRDAGFSYVSDFLENTANNDTGFEFEKIVYPAVNNITKTQKNIYSKVVQVDTHLVTPNSGTTIQWNLTQGNLSVGDKVVYANPNNELGIVQTTDINSAFATALETTFTTGGVYEVTVNIPYNIYLVETSPTGYTQWSDTGTFDFDDSYSYLTTLSLILLRNGTEYHIYDEHTGYVNYNSTYDFIGGYCLFKDTSTFEWSGNVHIQAGDKVYLKYTYQYDVLKTGGSGCVAKFGATDVGFWHRIQFEKTEQNSTQLGYTLLSTFTVGGKFDPTDVLNPKTKKIDFVKNIIQKFNLYVEDVTNKKDENGHYYSDRNYYPNIRQGEPVLRIEPRDMYYNVGQVVKDWTDKVDVTSLSFERIDDYLYNLLEFNDSFDDTFYVKDYNDYNYTEGEYGEQIIHSPFNVKNDQKTEVKTNLGQTMVGRLKANENSYLQCPFIFNIDDSGELKSDKEYNDRMLFVYSLYRNEFPNIFNHKYFALYERNPNITLPDWSYLVNRSNIATYNLLDHFNAPFGRDTADLNFGWARWYYQNLDGKWATSNNCYNQFYKQMIDDYNNADARMLTCKMYLSASDIRDLKLSDIIVVNNVVYHINKVKEWSSSAESVTVELIKIVTSNSESNGGGGAKLSNVVRPVTPLSVKDKIKDEVDKVQKSVDSVKNVVNDNTKNITANKMEIEIIIKTLVSIDERLKKLEEPEKVPK